jgi:hypothetical protein
VNYDRDRIVAYTFLLLSIASAVYISVASQNYLSLYPALDQIQSQVDKISFSQNSNTSESTLATFVSVKNPTGYSGLRIGKISVGVFLYVATNRSIMLFSVPNDLMVSQQILAQLQPNSVYSASISIGLTSQQANQTVSFIGQHMRNIVAEVTFTVDILTFLESVTGSVPYTRTQDIPLAIS